MRVSSYLGISLACQQLMLASSCRPTSAIHSWVRAGIAFPFPWLFDPRLLQYTARCFLRITPRAACFARHGRLPPSDRMAKVRMPASSPTECSGTPVRASCSGRSNTFPASPSSASPGNELRREILLFGQDTPNSGIRAAGLRCRPGIARDDPRILACVLSAGPDPSKRDSQTFLKETEPALLDVRQERHRRAFLDGGRKL